jgi:hypothetical protein
METAPAEWRIREHLPLEPFAGLGDGGSSGDEIYRQ